MIAVGIHASRATFCPKHISPAVIPSDRRRAAYRNSQTGGCHHNLSHLRRRQMLSGWHNSSARFKRTIFAEEDCINVCNFRLLQDSRKGFTFLTRHSASGSFVSATAIEMASIQKKPTVVHQSAFADAARIDWHKGANLILTCHRHCRRVPPLTQAAWLFVHVCSQVSQLAAWPRRGPVYLQLSLSAYKNDSLPSLYHLKAFLACVGQARLQ